MAGEETKGTEGTGSSGGAGRRPTPDELDALGDEIAQLAGQIAAATARFLQLLGEFDAGGGWCGPGIRSLAHWLSWRAGMSLRTAREHVRVARALRELPRTAEAFGRGELSFSKVRALSRVATSDTEAELVDVALNAPAAHVERLVAGLRKVMRDEPDPDGPGAAGEEDEDADDADEGPAEAPTQSLQWRWDSDTDELVVWGRFGAADGRLLLAALTRAELERVRTEMHEETRDDAEPADHEGDDDADGDAEPGKDETGDRPESVDRTAPPPSDAGPALLALAQIGLSVQEAPEHAPAAEVIYLHRHDELQGGSAEHPARTRQGTDTDREGAVVADDGPVLDPGTAQEVRCGGRARCVLTSGSGAVLAYGRSRRLFSAAQLRALRLRDRSCRTPGCQRTRFLHAHHVVFWSRGGATDLANAVLLCSACHRSVHLGRLRVEALGGQRFRFVDPATGKVIPDAPPVFGRADEILADRTIGPRTVTGGWEGEPLDLSLATSELLAQWRRRTDLPPDLDPTPWDDPEPRRRRNPWDWSDVA